MSFITRKSSCVNAIVIPPAAYQVLLLMSNLGGRGVPHPWLGSTPFLTWGVPHLWLGGLPYPWPGGTLTWGTPSHLELGHPQEGIWEQLLGYPQKGHDTSGSIMGWRWGNSPPPRWCGQTHICENSTFPILRMRAVINGRTVCLRSQLVEFHSFRFHIYFSVASFVLVFGSPPCPSLKSFFEGYFLVFIPSRNDVIANTHNFDNFIFLARLSNMFSQNASFNPSLNWFEIVSMWV